MTSRETLKRGPVTLRPAETVNTATQGEWTVEVDGAGAVGRLANWMKLASARRGGLAVREWTGQSPALLALAMRQLVDHLFWTGQFHKLELSDIDSRLDVLTAALRCGFVEEGRRRHKVVLDGLWCNQVDMGMVEDQWSRGMPAQARPFVARPSEPAATDLPPVVKPSAGEFAVLKGPRVTLRRKTARDKELLFWWLCRPEWWSGWMPEDPDGFRAPTRQEFESAWSAEPAPNDWVVETERGLPIGRCFYDSLDAPNRGACANILLYEAKSWGKGYGTEAFGVLLRHLFEDLRLHRVAAGTWSGNVGCLRVQQKNGLVLESRGKDCYRVDGRWYEGVGMGMLEQEYAQAAGANVKRQTAPAIA